MVVHRATRQDGRQMLVGVIIPVMPYEFMPDAASKSVFQLILHDRLESVAVAIVHSIFCSYVG